VFNAERELKSRKKRVFLTGEEGQYVSRIKSMLRLMGYTAVHAEDGLEASMLVKIMAPDAVLLDVDMPGLDCVDAVTMLRGIADTSALPVVMVCSEPSDLRFEECRRLGEYAYLVKPIGINDLHGALQDCLFSQYGYRRQYPRVRFNKMVTVCYSGQLHWLYAECISQCGIYIGKEEPVPAGSEIAINLPSINGNVITLNGMVIHAKRLTCDDEKVPLGFGVAFSELGSDQSAYMEEYIEGLVSEVL
jgi:CheY-like chemotaxis protein